MKVALATAAAAIALVALPIASHAQTPPQTPPPQKPAAPAAQAAPAPPPRPFPVGAKFGVVNLQQIATESAEGKASSAKISALNQKKVTELNDRNKALQAAQQKLVAGALLTESARAEIQKEINRLNLDIQRFTQDAQAEVDELQQQVQLDFQRKLVPIIELVAVDKGVQVVFANDNGIVWAEGALDLTAEVIRRFDGAMGTAPPKGPTAD